MPHAQIDTSQHPCFNVGVKGTKARIHLPVAPKCNLMCNFCNRKFDCVNESRPGVTSAVLSPAQAEHYLARALEREPRISVAGIAGPGDPFANARETLDTCRRIRRRWPDMILCLATNGLELGDYLDEVAEIAVSHVTVTVNAIDPDIAAKIYSWARVGKVLYRGTDAGAILLARQGEAIKGLKERGVIVKANTIVIPGVNDHHVEAVAARMRELGVDMLNCIPMHPNKDTKFEDVPEPSKELMAELRDAAEAYLPQMRHCKRCRADAVGLLDDDRSGEFAGLIGACSRAVPTLDEARPYVAVASLEGLLVNQHLGEAGRFLIFAKGDDGFALVEEREAPASGGGPNRWYALAEALKDCRAVLVAAAGETPKAVLEEEGLTVVEMNGLIDQGLRAVYETGDFTGLAKRAGKGCCGGLKGGGFGCG